MIKTKFRGQEHALIMQTANNAIVANLVLDRAACGVVCDNAVDCMEFFHKVKRESNMTFLKYPPIIYINGRIKVSAFESGLCIVTIATCVADLTIVAMTPDRMIKLLEGVTQVKRVYCIDEYMAFYAEYVMSFLKKELKRSGRIQKEIQMLKIIGEKE
ncbi:MAG: hypothetical protein J6Y64_11065 [Ruminococcus sp.]|nr:hypothetical protein [Ruminococcus sp.]